MLKKNKDFHNKIKSLSQLKNEVRKIKQNGKTVVFTNGCFDILHYGHVKYLQDAARLGDILVVGVNSDTSVRKIKGKNRPINNESDRARIIAALESSSLVTIFNEETPIELIRLVRPDVLVKGSDWKNKTIVGADFVLKHGGKVKTIRLSKGRSTTNIINSIAKRT